MKLWIEQEQVVATLPRYDMVNDKPTYYYNYKFSKGRQSLVHSPHLKYAKVPSWMCSL